MISKLFSEKTDISGIFVRVKKIIPFLFLFFFLTTMSVESHTSEFPYHYHHHTKKYDVRISDKKKFAWFKVYKGATRTIELILKKGVSDFSKVKQFGRYHKKFDDYFKFAFVRNPWDRIVSCYFHKVVTRKAKCFEKCFGKDFTYFVNFIHRIDVASLDTNAHVRLQTKLIPVNKLDFIGKINNFNHDFKHVCDVIGITYDHVPHAHKTEHAHYTTYYTPRTKKIIAKKYKEDIEAFGFTFEN